MADTGIGIPAGEVDHLFDRFFRASNARQARGAGQRAGPAHGQGHHRAARRPDRGGQRGGHRAPPSPSTCPIAAMTAVPAGPGNRGRAGHRPGDQGRAGVRRPGGADRRRRPGRAARLPRRPPGLVVLDVGLPVLDGWDVLDRIRDLSEVPVLMLTSHGLEAEKVRGLRGGRRRLRHQAVQQRRAAGPGAGAAAPRPARPGRAGLAEVYEDGLCRGPVRRRGQRGRPPGQPDPDRVPAAGRAGPAPGQVLSPGPAARPGLAGPGRESGRTGSSSPSCGCAASSASTAARTPIEAVRGFGYRYLPPRVIARSRRTAAANATDCYSRRAACNRGLPTAGPAAGCSGVGQEPAMSRSTSPRRAAGSSWSRTTRTRARFITHVLAERGGLRRRARAQPRPSRCPGSAPSTGT